MIRTGGSRVALTSFAILAIALCAMAMLFPALGTCQQISQGLVTWLANSDILLRGPFGAFFLEFGWYANIPLVIATITLFRARRVHSGVIVVQVILVLSSQLPVTLLGASEAPAVICRWGVGYWLWFAAHAIIVACSIGSRALRAA